MALFGVSLFTLFSLLLIALFPSLCFAADPSIFYDLRLSYITASPLGVPQQVIAVNGKFPGPLINSTTNDNVNVNVHNDLDENLLMTWSGIQMRRDSWQDGVLGTNCPILPKRNWTYQFQMKDQIGSFFYFPSLNFQRASGGFGPIIINNRVIIAIPFAQPDGDITITIGDWYTQNHSALRSVLDAGKGLAMPDGVLINGKGPYRYNNTLVPDGIEYETIQVDPGKTYRVRVHNVGISTSLNFRIQNHFLLLAETEGYYTTQQNFTSLDIHVGQSYSFLVTMDQNASSDYYIVASARFVNESLWQRVTGVAVLRYSNSKGPATGPLPDPPNDFYDKSWSMNQALSIRQNVSASGARPNPQGSFHYGQINVTQTYVIKTVPPEIINGTLRTTLNGISFVNPDTPIRLADKYNVTGAYKLDFPDQPLNRTPRVDRSGQDISNTIRHIYEMGSASELTVAARGHGHSTQGQAQAHQGVVINMESLQRLEMQVHTGKTPYVDVSGGELWINILHETLKHGLAPKSWTDYLHLTVGGTLSNAGISGQAFQHGPQISNVYQLEVVTGKGEVVTCSEKKNTDLFYGVLGGLGQFGIITRARISLGPAPMMVKWIRVLYSDFSIFTKDQEQLISSENSFDYIEGFTIINRTGLLNNWRSSFRPKDPVQANQFSSDGRTLYCLEVVKHFNPDDTKTVNQSIENLLSKLSYIPSTLFLSEVSYVEFLDRVHVSEKKLQAKGLWEIPHPWLNLLVPKSRISDFAEEIFGNILTDTSNGPILIYPVNQSKWNNKTSLVTPDEDVFYQVAFLTSAMPSSTGTDGLAHILTQNKRILDFCDAAELGIKQYLPHYKTEEEWQAHFGPRWKVFVQRKSAYDPLAILAPGQRIFRKAIRSS